MLVTVIPSVAAGVAAGLWFLAGYASFRRRKWWRSAGQLLMALVSLSSTIVLVLRGRAPTFQLPSLVSTVILLALFLIPAVMVYVDERQADAVIRRLKALRDE